MNCILPEAAGDKPASFQPEDDSKNSAGGSGHGCWLSKFIMTLGYHVVYMPRCVRSRGAEMSAKISSRDLSTSFRTNSE